MVINNNDLEIVSSSEGSKVIDEGLYKIVINSFDRVDYSNKELPVTVTKPKVTEADLDGLLPKLRGLVFTKMVVSYGDKKWNLDESQLLDLIGFQKGKDGTTKLLFSNPKFESFVEVLSQEINELPRGQVTTVDGTKVIDFKIIKEGKELDDRKFIEDFKLAFLNGEGKVQAPVVPVAGPGDKEKYGIYALLGEGKSNFSGSIPGRIHNLTLAAERTNGVLVPPGAIYSMNNSIGDVSAKTGYDLAYVISRGRTVLGEGGGVCQTSTTLFRAVLNSGLPVVMRYQHAYRVHYYENDSAVGFDASIFQPSVDFQFKNDTSNYVLVQSSWDLRKNELYFKIFGTPDGRTVEISKPIVSNQTPPPQPLYQDDPTSPKGVVKQVDWAAWGANVSFTRIVRLEGDIYFEDKFISRYQPWQAVYLVGTKQ